MFELNLSAIGNRSNNPVVPLPVPPSDALGGTKAMLMMPDGSSFYVVGGTNSGGAQTRATYRYDLAAGTWTKLADLPSGVPNTTHGRLALDGDNLYYFNRTQVLQYTISTNTWTTKVILASNSPLNGYGTSMHSYNGKIYTVQYSDGDYTPGTRLVEFDPVTSGVVARSTFTTSLIPYLGGAVVNGKLYMTHGASRAADKLSVCDLSTFVWTDINWPGGTDPSALACASARVGDLIYIIASNQKIPLEYNAANNTLKTLGPLAKAFSTSNQVVGFGNKLYLLSPTEFISYGI